MNNRDQAFELLDNLFDEGWIPSFERLPRTGRWKVILRNFEKNKCVYHIAPALEEAVPRAVLKTFGDTHRQIDRQIVSRERRQKDDIEDGKN